MASLRNPNDERVLGAIRHLSHAAVRNPAAGRTAHDVTVVIDVESEPPSVCGQYAGSDEDAIFYYAHDGTIHSAPADCVQLATVTVRL